MLETNAHKRRPQFGWCRLAEAWPIEVRLLNEQNAIACTGGEKSKNTAGRSSAGDRDVESPRRIQAIAGKFWAHELHAFDVARVFLLAAFLEATLVWAAVAATSIGALLNSTS